ncbi:MAG TPA: hypothetical protein VKD65_02820 [Candidatus Angelobacter sp.]|nr:hypothetical protein [Candidatus Angelobacter sp.]
MFDNPLRLRFIRASNLDTLLKNEARDVGLDLLVISERGDIAKSV